MQDRRAQGFRICLGMCFTWGLPKLTFLFSLPEFMNSKLFGKTILVVQKKFGLFWAIHSASQFWFTLNKTFKRVPVTNTQGLFGWIFSHRARAEMRTTSVPEGLKSELLGSLSLPELGGFFGPLKAPCAFLRKWLCSFLTGFMIARTGARK